MKFFEDVEVGDAYEIGPHLFSAEEIVEFARKYDPQRFHLSEEGGRDSQFGALCASGWHTVCAWMKHNVAEIERRMREAAKAGTRPPRIGPSPGFDDLRWLRPVFAGDQITYRNTTVAKRDLPRRPDWGLVNFQVVGTNQNGAEVVSFVGGFMLERREKLEGAA
jgi:acyl dehydratase